jgi:hypothetical protein
MKKESQQDKRAAALRANLKRRKEKARSMEIYDPKQREGSQEAKQEDSSSASPQNDKKGSN